MSGDSSHCVQELELREEERQQKLYAIVDCNSFYCSCERVFRPDLWDRPVVVLSNNDGCIVSRSDEAKKLGIGMAGPYFQARHLIEKNGVTVFSSNYHLYGDMSWRVMETLRTLSPVVEVYSVDEAFLELDGFSTKDIPAYARHIRQTVEQWTGVSVSVGIAPTKTLAKIANHLAKKHKSETGCVKLVISGEDQHDALVQTRVNSIWGVGGAYAQKLLGYGICSAWELRNMSPEWAYKNLGGVVGVRLIHELRGQPSIIMKDELTEKRMIATTRMFGKPVTELTDLKEAVATYVSRAAEKLRRQQSAARVVTVFVVPNERDLTKDYYRDQSISAHTTLSSATASTQELIKPALQVVEGLFESGKTYKKAGVMLSGIVPDASVQGNLFSPSIENMNRFLMDTIDNVNFSMRDDVLKFGSSGIQKNWKMRQELRSGRYSTRWEELKEVT